MNVLLQKFPGICSESSLPICPSLGYNEPICYARNIDIMGFMIFQPATIFVHLITILMTCIIIYTIRRKYTAVGRKEITFFFYVVILALAFEIAMISNLIPVATPTYKILSALHLGSLSASFVILFYTGVIYFQWFEDGTNISVCTIRSIFLVTAGAVAAFSMAIFTGVVSDPPGDLLYLIMYYLNGGIALLYVLFQLVLILRYSDNFWILGDLLFVVLFFLSSQSILFFGSNAICKATVHYVDGMFFAAIFNLLTIMMLYKYWDSITKDDLEFLIHVEYENKDSSSFSENM